MPSISTRVTARRCTCGCCASMAPAPNIGAASRHQGLRRRRMKHISSRDNPAVKALVKLAGLAGRRGASVLLDGVHLCRAWLDHHGLPEQAVFDAERLDQPELAALAAALPSERCLALDARLMQSLASVESGQGVAFVVAPRPCRVPWTRIACCSTASRIRAMSAPCCAPARRPASSACSWPPRPPPGRQGAAQWPGRAFRAGDS